MTTSLPITGRFFNCQEGNNIKMSQAETIVVDPEMDLAPAEVQPFYAEPSAVVKAGRAVVEFAYKYLGVGYVSSDLSEQ